MDYVVTAGLRPPVHAGELDQLQQQGVMSVLDHQLSQVEGVTGPSDEDIDVLDYRIEVHPDGATVMLALDAPALPTAEDAAATVLTELLGESAALGEWAVSRSEVRITEDEFNQSLAAASGTEDSALGEAELQLEAAVEEVLESSEDEALEPLDTGHWRDKILGLAPRLRAFDAGAFTVEGDPDGGHAELAAGALVHAVTVVTDELFYDELALTVNDATVDEAVGLLVLEELPPCYQGRYDARFARSLLLASSVVATNLTAPGGRVPRTVAEALALRLFVNEARVVLEAAELMDWHRSERVFAAFSSRAFLDSAHEELFEVDFPLDHHDTAADVSPARVREVVDALHARGLTFEQWFHRRDAEGPDDTSGVHPYTTGH